MHDPQIIALVGNPNSGKTTLFNHLVGKHAAVGNWCGVTVEQNCGYFKEDTRLIKVVDLPGCYQYVSSANKTENALDERITHEYLSTQKIDLIINVVDAGHLGRHLYLTIELLEAGFPIIVVLNMMDIVKKQGLKIDIEKLAKRLGCPVVPLIALNEEELLELKKAIRLYKTPTVDNRILSSLSPIAAASNVQLAKVRYDLINNVVKAVVTKVDHVQKFDWTQKIDTIVLNRFLAIPLFLALIYVVFASAIQVGGIFQPYFDWFSSTIFITQVKDILIQVQAPDWCIRLMAFGVGQGFKTTLSFIPVITAMFFSISFLEASGYMARAAFIMDRVMQWIGLPGKAFVPMIIGFGCNVPAVMATRTLENYRERILTVLMSPFMSCGARLAIYALFVSAFFPVGGQNIIFGLYLIGIAVALMTGFVLRTTVLAGKRSHFILELPSYRWPHFLELWRTTGRRLKQFILKAGALIVPLCAVIALLGVVQDKAETNDWLKTTGQTLTPLFAPMGIKKENWPATVGLITGVLAKEVVVGTLNALYTEEALRSENSVSENTISSVMVEQFGSKVAAFSYLLFVLLYFPCVSVVATMARELNRKWAIFSVVWTTSIAYITAVLFYQCATFLERPWSAFTWISGMSGLLIIAFYSVRRWVSQRLNRQSRAFSIPTQIKTGSNLDSIQTS